MQRLKSNTSPGASLRLVFPIGLLYVACLEHIALYVSLKSLINQLLTPLTLFADHTNRTDHLLFSPV